MIPNLIKFKVLSRKNIVKIEDVVITKEQLDKIAKYRKNHSVGWFSNHSYMAFLRGVVKIDGLCCICDKLPDKKIYYKSGFVERYCNNCIDHSKDDLKTHKLNEKVTIMKYENYGYVVKN